MLRRVSLFLEHFSVLTTRWTGSTLATVLAFLSILIWFVAGFWVGFTDSFQMVINTGTTIVTFLMVFLIQRAQNKDALAMQTKLNELLAATHRASSKLINLEDLSEEQVRELHDRYQRLREVEPGSHSIDDPVPD